MKVDQKGHTTIIKDTESDTGIFLKKLSEQYNTFKKENLIIDISQDKTVSLDSVTQFQTLAKMHQENKKSFVLVTDAVDFNMVPDSITVVPTLLEAHDIIEMEEIERDLGF